MENTNLQQQQSNQETSKNPLVEIIIEIVKAMRADYGAIFKRTFSDDEDLRLYKNRLYQKLKPYPIDCIVDGYESCVSNNVKFCPTVPEIVAAVLDTVKTHKKRDENKAEAERVSALPAPTISCNPVEMLLTAKKLVNQQDETKEDWMARKAEILKNHEALLVIHSHKINRHYASPEHGCMYGGCRKPGSISSGTTGKGNYYCAEHYRMS